MLSTPCGITTRLSIGVLLKALLGMALRFLESVTLVRDVLLQNAVSFMVVTESGMTMDCSA